MIDPLKLQSALTKNTANALAQLNSIRGEIQEINDEIHWLDNAPLNLTDTLDNINQSIDQRAQNALGVEGFFYNRTIAGKNSFEVEVSLKDAMAITGSNGYISGSGSADIGNILCSLFGETVKAKFSDLAKAMAGDIESGPPLIERPGLKAELLEKKKMLEVAEEKLIETADELGLYGFYRRPDCDPKIVLLMD